ncbi:MAG: hypothetical protein EA427_02595 [Spirochaetaceae bacterium]|nr:MAG: hypothetical protein EA427_02595 [Spirochaetaceae bacterium]
MIGTAIILTGAALLLVTTGVVSLGAMGIPVALILAGAFFLHRAFRPQGAEINLFYGILLTLIGVFFVLQQSILIRSELRSLWPIFMTFGGLTLMVYGFRKGKPYPISLVLPGCVLCALSLVFLLFSLNVIEQSLASLTARWWPLIFVPLGVLILLPGRAAGEEGESSGNGDPEVPGAGIPGAEIPGDEDR